MHYEKQYKYRIVALALAYGVTLLFSIIILKALPAESGLRIPVAVLPVMPIVFGVLAFLHYMRHLDELQRRIQFEGLAFSVGCTGLITFTLGFLENAGFPSVNVIWVMPMLIAFWGIGTVVASRRYS
jgi:hypothetical protein